MSEGSLTCRLPFPSCLGPSPVDELDEGGYYNMAKQPVLLNVYDMVCPVRILVYSESEKHDSSSI